MNIYPSSDKSRRANPCNKAIEKITPANYALPIIAAKRGYIGSAHVRCKNNHKQNLNIMPKVGTKKFWKPANGASSSQKENQVLKNSGYISIQMLSVNYLSKGNFWQKIFGGTDKIALTTTLRFQTGVESIEATSVQDIREVKANASQPLGIQKPIAVKIPATSDALSISVKMTAVKNDKLESKMQMLNQDDFRKPLELAPKLIGEVFTVTSLVKKLFTETDPQNQLEADFAGIISIKAEDNPVMNSRLTRGTLIMVSAEEGNSFEDVDETKFEVRGDRLYYNQKEVENTYLLFNILFEEEKGASENAPWFKKYKEAINYLDKIFVEADESTIEKIEKDAINLWVEGNGLLGDDSSYTFKEQKNIKNTFHIEITDRLNEIKAAVLKDKNIQPIIKTSDLKQIIGNTISPSIAAELPVTGSFFVKTFKIGNTFNETEIDEQYIYTLLKKDSEEYNNKLNKENKGFDLSKK